jgi:hypothetical protein
MKAKTTTTTTTPKAKPVSPHLGALMNNGAGEPAVEAPATIPPPSSAPTTAPGADDLPRLYVRLSAKSRRRIKDLANDETDLRGHRVSVNDLLTLGLSRFFTDQGLAPLDEAVAIEERRGKARRRS